MDGKANTNHAHNIIKDSNDASNISISYSKDALGYSDYTWLAAWNGRELRAVNKSNYYSRSEIDEKIKNITGGGTVLAQSLSIALNGGTTEGTNKFTFDGSLAKSINVTAASVGALPLAGGTITGDVTVNGKVLTVINNGRISVKKDTTYDAATKAYLSWNDAFYTAYSEKKYSLIMLTPAITAKNAYPGNLGIHQENGGLYVGFQNNDKKSRKDIKLIASDGTTDLVLKSDNVLYASRVAKLANNKTDLTTMIGDDWTHLATINSIAWWNGRFNSKESSLQYCSLGAFGNAACKATRSLTAIGPCGWVDQTTDDKYVPTMALLAFWDGSFSVNKTDSSVHDSNLAYCNMGKFGTAVTRNISHGTGAPSNSGNEGDIYIQLS